MQNRREQPYSIGRYIFLACLLGGILKETMRMMDNLNRSHKEAFETSYSEKHGLTPEGFAMWEAAQKRYHLILNVYWAMYTVIIAGLIGGGIYHYGRRRGFWEHNIQAQPPAGPALTNTATSATDTATSTNAITPTPH